MLCLSIIVIVRLTEATSTPWLCAMCPRMEKVTVPASKHVPVFTRQVITVSLGGSACLKLFYPCSTDLTQLW